MGNQVLDIKKIKVLGYTTDYNTCDCCGREGLKGTVKIEIDGNYVHYGTSCAASADKYDTLEAIKIMKKEVNKAKNVYDDKYKYAALLTRKMLKSYGLYAEGVFNESVHTQILGNILKGVQNNHKSIFSDLPLPVDYLGNFNTNEVPQIIY